MEVFLSVSNWAGILCGAYVVYKLARVALKKDNK